MTAILTTKMSMKTKFSADKIYITILLRRIQILRIPTEVIRTLTNAVPTVCSGVIPSIATSDHCLIFTIRKFEV